MLKYRNVSVHLCTESVLLFKYWGKSSLS